MAWQEKSHFQAGVLLDLIIILEKIYVNYTQIAY